MTMIDPKRRRGVVAVMALIFLAVCAALATGLVAMSLSSTAVTGNELHVTRAQAALDTGVQFFQSKLKSAMSDVSSAPTAANINSWMSDFRDKLDGVLIPNVILDSSTTPPTIDVSAIGWGTDASFSAKVTSTTNATLFITVTGTCTSGDTVTRNAQMSFTVTPQIPGAPVPFALVTKGDIPSCDNVNRTGTKHLTYIPEPVTFVDGSAGKALRYPDMPVVTGPVTFPNNDSLVQTVAALNLPLANSVNMGTAKKPVWAVNGIASGGRIAANTNVNLTGTLNGVIYVEYPNSITLTGTVVLNGTIVFQRGSGQTSKLTLNRDATITRNMATSTSTIANTASNLTGRDMLKWYTIIGPDTTFELANGTVWDTTKAFEGSLHIKTFSRQGGGNDLAMKLSKGGILAEGNLTFQSNGSRYWIDPDTNGVSGGESTPGTATLTWNTYEELLN